MKYSANLPIEEQRRLDQLHLGMGSGNPYREGGLASVNPFAVGLFPTPAIQAAPTKDLYDSWTPEQKSEWDRYGEFGKPRPADHGPGSFGPEVRPKIPEGEVGQRFNDDTYRPSFPGLDWLRPGILEPQPEYQLPQPEVMPNPFGPNIDDTYPTADEVRPQPGPQPIDTPFPISRPIISPRPAPIPTIPGGGMPRPGSITTPLPKVPTGPDTAPDPIFEYPPTVMPQPTKDPLPGPPNRPPPNFPPFVALPTGQQQSGLTYSDDEKIRPPSIQLSRKHGGSLTQTVLNVLRNLS
jgi:hypothetical protein